MATSPWDHVTLLLPRDDHVSLIQHLGTGNDSTLVDSRIFLVRPFLYTISLGLRALLFLNPVSLVVARSTYFCFDKVPVISRPLAVVTKATFFIVSVFAVMTSYYCFKHIS